MEDYTDAPASGKLDDSASVPIQQQIATRDELFPAVLKYVKRASLARTATELLFWSQYATHEFKGRRGIYKQDDELGKSLGIHPKTAGRHVLALCATGSKNEPGAKVRLFELDYGPKPRAHGGRVRWLFVRPEGCKIIAEALEGRRLRRKRAAPTDGKEKFRPGGARQSNRSPQNAPTPSHLNLSKKRSGELSIQDAEEREPRIASKGKKIQGKIELGGQEEVGGVSEGKVLQGDSQGQVGRLVQSWRAVCERSNKHDLIWRDQELDRLSIRVAKTVGDIRLHEITDADLEARLTVLCNDIVAISEDMSEGFAKYNRHGLELSSFAMYGPKLMKLAAEKVSSEPAKKAKPGGKIRTWAEEPFDEQASAKCESTAAGQFANFKHAGATFE